MRFQVPQFIGVEDKLFGPFTLKQFIYLAGGGGLAFIIWNYLKWWGLPLILAAIGFALALAFYKINGKTFVEVLESAFKFYSGSRLYTWKKEAVKKTPLEEVKKEVAAPLYVPKLSMSKLKDLTWSLDIKETLNPVTEDEGVRHGNRGGK